MQPGPGSWQGRDVVVGPSRPVAARAFGATVDNAHVTSYDDFRTEVDLAALGTVGLVAAAEKPEELVELVGSLTADPGLRPSSLAYFGSSVVVVLRPAAEVAEADSERILGDLRRLRAKPVPGDEPNRRLLGRLVSRFRP